MKTPNLEGYVSDMNGEEGSCARSGLAAGFGGQRGKEMKEKKIKGNCKK